MHIHAIDNAKPNDIESQFFNDGKKQWHSQKEDPDPVEEHAKKDENQLQEIIPNEELE